MVTDREYRILENRMKLRIAARILDTVAPVEGAIDYGDLQRMRVGVIKVRAKLRGAVDVEPAEYVPLESHDTKVCVERNLLRSDGEKAWTPDPLGRPIEWMPCEDVDSGALDPNTGAGIDVRRVSDRPPGDDDG